ncbi:MAG TPA: aminotransferase class III-fold pyridoxal phosphate-dependent enzyme [Bryobacteraceae bacterium]|nr:aminotransferase class III-fold pyridoxal phosphate-dependent enzyme [Bryobacteraceae bacterium]
MPADTSLPQVNGFEKQVAELTCRVLGLEVNSLDPSASFASLGADSLTMLQLSQAIYDDIGVRVPFRLMFDAVSTLQALCEHIRKEHPEKAPGSPVAKQQTALSAEDSEHTRVESLPPNGSLDKNSIERILALQLQIMDQQLGVLRAHGLPANVETPIPESPRSFPNFAEKHHETRNALNRSADDWDETRTISQQIDPEPFVPHRAGQTPGLEPRDRPLTGAQREFIDTLACRVSRKTAGSKRLAAEHRRALADSRQTAGFQTTWKEMCYPLVASRGQEAHVWDIDGNQYVDFTMGFGALLFGHSPAFLSEALQRQIQNGIQLGLQSNLAGEAAEIICEMTGVERVAYCNSGTEAIMAALRLARRATARNKIVTFAGAYHGSFDGVLVKGEKAGSTLRTVPLTHGIPQHMIENVTVLEYGSPKALEELSRVASECAAILVEPAQSRRPDLQPKRFLKDLRRIATEAKAVLIFDEVVTGFRAHQGGAQALFDVQADLVAYGKAVGGGIPIGIVAGKATYMDAIDGGHWTFGDDSLPLAETTFFAGTYFKHPLTAAAVHATLSHLKREGPELQERLSHLTSQLVTRLNALLEEVRIPVRAVSFGSLFRFIPSPSLRYWDLFYYGLLERGIYICETRTCFLSTAHTQSDLDTLLQACTETIREMKAAGLLPEGTLSIPGAASSTFKQTGQPRTVPLTPAQAGLLVLTTLGPQFNQAYNESMVLKLQGPLDTDALRRALDSVTNRHEALRASFSVEDMTQSIAPAVTVELPSLDLTDLPELERQQALQRALEVEARAIFDIGMAPLVRTKLIALTSSEHILCFTAHHLVVDGWSFGILLSELGHLYSLAARGEPLVLTPAARMTDFVQTLEERQQQPGFREDERYWLTKFAAPIKPLDLPYDRPRPALQDFTGKRHKIVFDDQVRRSLKLLAASNNCSLFVVLLASVQSFLHRLTSLDDIVVGTHSAGQAGSLQQDLVGFCVHLLPIRARFAGNPAFPAHLSRVKQDLSEALLHQHYPLGRLVKTLRLVRDPSRPPLVNFIVNLDRIPASRGRGKGLFHGLEIETLESPVSYSRFDMLWNVLDSGDQLSLNCTYSCALFNESTIVRWAREYLDYLTSLIAEIVDQRSSLDDYTAARSRLGVTDHESAEAPAPALSI